MRFEMKSFGVLTFLMVVACGGQEATKDAADPCVPGRLIECACFDERATGSQECLSSGTWGECECLVGQNVPLNPPCQPQCDNRNCGEDGCGGVCGQCSLPESCEQGSCVEVGSDCVPDCDSRSCGADGCGGFCEPGCSENQTCVNGSCQTDAPPCEPNCTGRECGADGCGGVCPSGCEAGESCVNGECQGADEPCVPNCSGRMCGSDGCGGVCGQCSADAPYCEEGTCVTSCSSPSCTTPAVEEVLALLGTNQAADLMDQYVLISQRTGPTDMEQSTEYRWRDFLTGYASMAFDGIGGEVFFVGDDLKAGLINIAAFLAQSMQETIQYNACDENNWSINLGVPNYPATAACGQAGQDYQQYHCLPEESHMQCPVDPMMMIQARTQAAWGGAPPPLFCAPTSVTGPKTPRWSYGPECGPAGFNVVAGFDLNAEGLSPWIVDNVVEGVEAASCSAYEGQFAGKFTYEGCDADGCWNTDHVDTAGGQRYNNVEGCCWWGRGVIQTTGPCNFGKLNYYLAGREYIEADGVRTKNQVNTQAPYAQLDFCEDPELVCKGPGELKWIAGMLYWLNGVQGYPVNDSYQWDYKALLVNEAGAVFADPQGPEAKALVDATSGVVNRGCPALSCPGAGHVHEPAKRFENFKRVMLVMKHLFDPASNPAPAGPPAPPAEGDWWSPEVLCQACGEGGGCALKYSKAGATSCVSWATDEQSCRNATTVAAAWCGDSSSTSGGDDSASGDSTGNTGSMGGGADCTTCESCGCSGCVFASNGQCYDDITERTTCEAWPGNLWCGD